ncbi:BON domain-containing protein [Dyadobacter sp. NIV53]|uniref:BON domain-containing protein n=1 Tax=Dyadobacter sp. NIV53 TaxID=2861765 RepID=UPI001C880738|nr:BON domain-containing protein [Dyadobacter sp. NIV53]
MKTDIQIQQDVMEQIKWQSLLNAAEIGVSVKDGIVTLSGHVDTYAKKTAAEKAAKKVKGVKAIAEEICVGISTSDKKNDGEIAEAVANALKWNSAVKDEKIKIKVEDGFVTLTGEVEWDIERTNATDAIKNLTGVVMVFNLVTIKPKPLAENVSQKIQAAFARHASIDASKIKVEIVGNKAILTGYVRSFVESEDAEAAAWAAPGVNAVENKLEIGEEEFAYN